MTEPTPEPDHVAGDDDEVTDMAAVRKLRNEAKRLRHLLREEQANRASEAAKHQAERESDLARIATYEKAEVERAAATVLVDPEDVWRHTSAEEQAAFNDEFGSIVGTNVVEVAKRLAAERPHLARPNTAPPPTARPIEGLRPGASPEPKTPPVPTWATALRGH
jgi:hypothetical protein